MFTYLHSHITRVPGQIKRRKVELDPQVSPEEIMSRELELGCESWTSFASGRSSTAVQRTLFLWFCPARRLKQQLRSALVAAQWRGDTALTLPLFWGGPRSLRSFSGGIRGRASTPPPPPPPPTHTHSVPVPNKQLRFCGRKAKCACILIPVPNRPSRLRGR